MLGLCAYARTGRADNDFFSSKPGDLSSSHKDLDAPDRCNDCHVNGSKDLSNDKCLACHDHNNLRDRISSGKGFHASAAVKGKACEKCHLEHKGRNFDLEGWKSIPGGQDQFNHDLTGWPLHGKHATNNCPACHKKKDHQGLVVYMGTDRLCGAVGCHANDQPHKFEQSE